MENEKTGTADRLVTTLIRWIDRRHLDPTGALQDSASVKFYSGSILLSACQVAQRAEEQPHSVIATILLAVASAEAFIQELAAHIDRCHKAHDWTPDAITPSLIATAQAIASAPAGLIDKYAAAAASLGKPFDAGGRLLKDAGRLVGFQQCILGREPERRAETLADELAARGITKARQPQHLPWFHRLQNTATAAWAIRSAQGLVLATLDLIPAQAIEPVRAVQALYQGIQTRE